MTAMRVIMAWVYCNTQSLIFIQLMHISSTGFLVILSPSPMKVQSEPFWNFVYSIVLWTLVILIIYKFGNSLVLRKSIDKSKPVGIY